MWLLWVFEIVVNVGMGFVKFVSVVINVIIVFCDGQGNNFDLWICQFFDDCVLIFGSKQKVCDGVNDV